jgi:hypothetical protein
MHATIPALTCVPWEANEGEDHSRQEASIGHPMDKAVAPFSRSTELAGLTTHLDSFSKRSLYRRLVRPEPVR